MRFQSYGSGTTEQGTCKWFAAFVQHNYHLNVETKFDNTILHVRAWNFISRRGRWAEPIRSKFVEISVTNQGGVLSAGDGASAYHG